jgi:hypothetical protein
VADLAHGLVMPAAVATNNFIGWLEGKLHGLGVNKVIPDQATLAKTFRKYFVQGYVRAALPGLVQEARERLQRLGVPENLEQFIEESLRRNRELPWDLAVAAKADEVLHALRDGVM